LIDNNISSGAFEMEAFADLPDALVRDLLAKAVPVANTVTQNVEVLRQQKDSLRKDARTQNLIFRKADLDVVREPSVVGIDGSYQIHHLTAIDLSAAAAVAVEGTAKEARRFWPQPYHQMWVESVKHSINAVGPIRGLMVSMELGLAYQAPHDLVLLDGSFASLVIYLNQALTSLPECPALLCSEFLSRWNSGLMDLLLGLLKSDRTVAIPKFTARNELIGQLQNPPKVEIDGKTLATLLLEPGEYTAPLPILQQGETYHLADSVTIHSQRTVLCSQAEEKDLNTRLKELRVIYFRPFGWIPALRLELPMSIANSNSKLSLVLEGITRQFFSPAVIEPYPLFLADRMVKSLGSGVAVIEQAVAQQVAGTCSDVETTMLFLQNYRTEGGRGGV
jgi:hypothetical protein